MVMDFFWKSNRKERMAASWLRMSPVFGSGNELMKFIVVNGFIVRSVGGA